MRVSNLHFVATSMVILTFTLPSSDALAGTLGWTGPAASDWRRFHQDTTISFSRDVFPILERTCVSCHGGVGPDGEVVTEEGLDMTTYEKLIAGSLYGTVVEPGDPDESYLMELIIGGDMPKEGDPLAPEEIEVIRRWIAAGAANN